MEAGVRKICSDLQKSADAEIRSAADEESIQKSGEFEYFRAKESGNSAKKRPADLCDIILKVYI